MLTSYLTMVHMSKCMLFIQDYLLSYRLHLGFPSFLTNVLFCLRVNPEYHVVFRHHVSSGLAQFLRLFLLFMTLAIAKSAGQTFCRVSSIWVCLMLFSRWAWGKKITEVKCSAHHIIGNISADFSLVMVILISWFR